MASRPPNHKCMICGEALQYEAVGRLCGFCFCNGLRSWAVRKRGLAIMARVKEFHEWSIGVTRKQIIQECINAITADGLRVREGSNESWRQGMFYAAEILRKMKSDKIGASGCGYCFGCTSATALR